MRRPFVALLLLATASATHAQHSLVLSGGGSRGLAHAGVVVGLERLGYSPPLVVGTSMGAVIGALYAAGYTPVEIWDIVARQDWEEMFAADPFPVGPDRQPRRPVLSIGFAQSKDEPVLEGFVSQSGINRRLTHLLFDAGVRARNDFDQLPRRFRAVATDLRTGGEYVLASGDLARAVRASMAVPGAFAPVRWGERVLVDGGIANNLGINVARSLAPLPVIGVDVVRPAGELEEVSALHIGLRAVRLLLHNTRTSRDSAEILVVPRIDPGFPETRFPEDAGILLLAGYEAAMAQLPANVVPMDAVPPPNAPPDRIDAVRAEGVTGAIAALVDKTFATVLGEYDPHRVLEHVDALYSTGMFHGVWPRLEQEGGRTVLVVRAEPISAAVVTGALGWDSDVGPRLWSAVRSRTVLVSPLEARVSMSYDRLHRWVSASGTFYSTIAPPLTWMAGSHWRERKARIFEDSRITDEHSVQRFGIWLGAEWRSLRRQESLTVAMRAEEIRADHEQADGRVVEREVLATGYSVGPYLRFGGFPHTDRAVGIDDVLEAEVRFGEYGYRRLLASGAARLDGARTRAALVGTLAVVSPDAPIDAQPYLGGMNGAPWLREGELRGNAMMLVGADVAYPVIPAGRLRVRVRSGSRAADLGGLGGARWIHGIEFAGLWNTALGPVAAGLASGTNNEWRLNLTAGASW